MNKKQFSDKPDSNHPDSKQGNLTPNTILENQGSLLVFDHLLEGFQIINFEWRYLYANEAVLRHSHKKKKDLIGNKFTDVWPGIEQTELFQVIKQALEKRTAHRLENHFTYPNGETAWFDLSIQPIPEGVFILSVDITKRKIFEKALKDKEAIFQKVFEASNVGKSITSIDGKLIANEAFCKMLGYTHEELEEKTWKELTPAEDIKKVQRYIEPLMNGETDSARFKKRYLHKNGSIIWADLNTVIQKSADGEPQYFITTALDITEQITNQRALENKERLLRLFIEYSPAPIAMFDTEMRYIVASNRYCLDFNLQDQDLKGKSHYEVFPEIPDQWKRIHQDCLKGNIRMCNEDPFFREDGQTDWLRWEIHPWHTAEDEIGGIIIFCEMITDLVAAREKAFESDRLKSIFLANMSHEIRTPLNAIMGFSSLLASGDEDPQQQIEYAQLINESGERLLALINDILDISKLEAGQFQINLEEEFLYPIIQSSFQSFLSNKLLLQRPELDYRLEFSEDLEDCIVKTDCYRFQQVLENLISNAIKCTNKGHIVLKIARSEHADSEIMVSVEDTGIGIPEDKNDLIFERFRQVEENQFHEGSGLGLSISKAIIERLGGSIGFHSEPGKGSTFYFTHPLHQARNQVKSVAHNPDKPNSFASFEDRDITIYIAEDDDYSYLYLLKLLKSPCNRIVRAKDGQKLMEMMQEKVPDLLLLDINMPVKNGLDCLEEIQKLNLTTKIIVQTGYAMSYDRTRFRNAGCDAYITKPIDRNHLFQTIFEVMDWGKSDSDAQE